MIKVLSVLLCCLCGVYTATCAAESVQACTKAVKAGDGAQALAIADTLIKKEAKFREAWVCKAKAHTLLNQTQEATQAATQAEALSSSSDEHMLGLTLLGDMEKNQGLYEAALKHLRESLSISTQQKSKGFERVDHYKIGEVYRMMGDYKAALAHFESAQKLGMNDDERADDYQRLADCYKALQDNERYLEYQLKAIQRIEALSDPERLALAYEELAKIYAGMQQWMSAENTLNKLMKLSKEYQNLYYEAKTLFLQAHLHHSMGDTTKAQTLKDEASTLAKKAGAEDLLRQPPSL